MDKEFSTFINVNVRLIWNVNNHMNNNDDNTVALKRVFKNTCKDLRFGGNEEDIKSTKIGWKIAKL